MVLVGDCGVSKTSVLNKLPCDKVKKNNNRLSELELRMTVKDRDVILAIWDTCGKYPVYLGRFTTTA